MYIGCNISWHRKGMIITGQISCRLGLDDFEYMMTLLIGYFTCYVCCYDNDNRTLIIWYRFTCHTK